MRHQRAARRSGPARRSGYGVLAVLALISGLTLLASASLALAGWSESAKEVSAPPQAGSSLTLPADGNPAPVYFPPDESGYPGEWRDPRDTAPYLAWHKAHLMSRMQKQMLREEPDPAEANYDARTYVLELSPNPTTQILTGKVTMRATVVNGPMTQCVLDLEANMTISSLTSGGTAATYTRSGNLLYVNLDRAYAVGETFTLVISYSGNPVGDAWGWDTHASQPIIWTLSEPFGARTWWPCKDYPDDKADSVDIKVTAPTGLITASNGTLRQQTDNGTTAFSWWHENHPISTYLVMLAIHPYHVYSDWYKYSPTDSMEIRFYNYASSIPSVEAVQAKVKTMIASYASRFGQYPFLDEKYGHAEFPWSGGMEHQTCTSLGYFGESVVAHELGHQWWGDMVTCKDFHHVWLNEGFATYCEALWSEATGGMSAYHSDININQYFGSGTVYCPDLTDFNRIFDSNLSYNKGSWVLHMLRGMVGDTAFFQILQTYYTQYKYSAATTEDFQAVAEAVSGRDLTAFFQEWVYGEYYPIYQYSWSAAPAGGGYDLTFNLQQVQTWQLFTMSVPVVVTTASGTQTFQVENSLANQSYTLHVAEQPTAVALDPDNWILRVVMAPIPVPSFDRNLLVVNGIDWPTYGTEITTAYTDKAFSGDYSFDFWDYFSAPSGGYPTNVPAPLGHGAVPDTVLAHYKNVIWVGNNYNGDMTGWNNSPIYSYLADGGNVLLLTREADLYLTDPFRNYLGVSWLSAEGTVTDCISAYTGLTNIGKISGATQNAVMGFNTTTLGTESTMLYKAVSGHTPNWGLGVIRQPAGGGTYNPSGGRFVLLSGRPYRWVHTDLKTNIMYILAHFFGLPNPADAGPGPTVAGIFKLQPPSPNPFGRETALRYSLPATGPAHLAVWDVTGRKIRSLLDGPASAGSHLVRWDGRDQKGHEVASGLYYVSLEAGGQSLRQKILRLR